MTKIEDAKPNERYKTCSNVDCVNTDLYSLDDAKTRCSRCDWSLMEWDYNIDEEDAEDLEEEENEDYEDYDDDYLNYED